MIYLIRLSICFLLVLALIIPIIFVSLLIKIDSKGPVIHWSKRIGINNSIFYMPKFRTMTIKAPQISTALMSEDINYVTRVGYFLRKLSIDEIPQIYSIIKGDMAFVGPRPALFNQRDLIKLRSKNGIDKILPGVTGWAQINGRDNISIKEKIDFEVDYINKQSLFFDFKIVLLTLIKILNQNDISH